MQFIQSFCEPFMLPQPIRFVSRVHIFKIVRYPAVSRRQSPRTEADAAHVAVKTEMLRLRLAEKKREPVRRVDVNALIDGVAKIGHTALVEREAVTLPLDHAFGFELPDVGRAAIKVLR
jgi:hypothetical protein